jgi:isochorismate pyruvate lyase
MIVTDIELAKNCQNMLQVRQGVDVTDAALITLLAKRFSYMDAAARIKTDRSSVRDEHRKHAVIANAIAAADQMGVPKDIVAAIWEILVEGSISYEMTAWDELHG